MIEPSWKVETSKDNLSSLFAAAYECPPEEFEKKLLWQCLYPHAVPFARLIFLVNPNFFKLDLQMLHQLGTCTSYQELHFEFETYRYYNPPTGLFQRWLRVRVSGQKLINVGAKLLKGADESK